MLPRLLLEGSRSIRSEARREFCAAKLSIVAGSTEAMPAASGRRYARIIVIAHLDGRCRTVKVRRPRAHHLLRRAHCNAHIGESSRAAARHVRHGSPAEVKSGRGGRDKCERGIDLGGRTPTVGAVTVESPRSVGSGLKKEKTWATSCCCARHHRESRDLSACSRRRCGPQIMRSRCLAETRAGGGAGTTRACSARHGTVIAPASRPRIRLAAGSHARRERKMSRVDAG